MNTPEKSAQQKLESWKGTFLKLGMVLSMLFVLFAFQYKAFERVVPEFDSFPDLMVEDVTIPVTIPKPPPPPPPSLQPVVTAPDEEIEEEYIPEIDIEAFPNQPAWDYSEIVYVEPEAEEDDLVHVRAEIMPEFPGGAKAMYAFLYSQITYPGIARELNIQGRVFVGFIIEKDGSVSNVHIKRGIGGGCDEEALRAVSNMPRWIPGRMGTQPVRVSYSLPVVFKLQ